jgi:hypothetical protein
VPSKFEETWNGHLVVAAKGTVPPALMFLEEVGLPSPILYGDLNWPGRLSFEHMVNGLETVRSFLGEDETNDPTQKLFVVGEEQYEGGAAVLWCIDPVSTNVVRFDVETNVVTLVSATPERLAEALVALRDWALMPPESRSVADLRQALEAIGGLSPHWTEFCAYAESLAATDVTFRIDDR